MKLGQITLSRSTTVKPLSTLLPTLFLLLGLCGASAWAQEEVFRARLSPMPTTPLTVDRIIGEGEAILTLNGDKLSVTGRFTGMSSGATVAHIHNGPPAQPGPVIFALELADGSISGEFELSDTQLQQLRGNAFYIQIHSENNPAGELRGWVFLRSHFDG